MPARKDHHHERGAMASGANDRPPWPMIVHPNGQNQKKGSDEFSEVLLS